jgi:MFS family permease
MQTGAPVGVGLAALVGGLVAPAIGWRATFLASGASAVLVALVRRALPESDVWLEHRRAVERGELPVARASRLRRLLGSGLRRVTFAAFVLTLFNMSAYWIAFTWMPQFLKGKHGLDLNRSVLPMLTIVLGELVGYGAFGAVSDRIGRKPAFTLFAAVFAAGLLLVTLAWDALLARPIVLYVALVLTGVGTGTWSSFGPYFSELYPTPLRTFGVSTVFNLARGVQFMAPLLADADRPATIALGALFSLLAAAWVWTLPETRGREIRSAE